MGGCRFGLAAEELAFAQAELGAELFELGLEFGDALGGAVVHALPVAGLLSQFEVFGEQGAASAAQRK